MIKLKGKRAYLFMKWNIVLQLARHETYMTLLVNHCQFEYDDLFQYRIEVNADNPFK